MRVVEREKIEALTDQEAIETARARFRQGVVEVWLHRVHIATFDVAFARSRVASIRSLVQQ